MDEPQQKRLYKVPAINPPTKADIQRITKKLNLSNSDEEVDAYAEHCSRTIESLNRVEELDDYDIEVKYSRTPGHRPRSDANKYNQWYWRCDIQGAKSGKLLGKTLGIKDNVAVAGVPMMNGSRILEGYTPEIDATIVTRILDAGGRILGKTACENLCESSTSFTNAKAPTMNPYDVTRTAGGSSSGSAVAVQIGDVDLAIGGDQGGSIRMPASFCGIVGLKPSFGLVPYTGIFPGEFCRDYVGPMTKTVTECALLLEVIAGYDGGLDTRQPFNIEIPEYSKLLETDLNGRKIGVIVEGFQLADESVSECVLKAVEKFKMCGVSVENVSIPIHKDGLNIINAVASWVQQSGNVVWCGWSGYRCLSMQEAAMRGAELRPNDFGIVTKRSMVAAEYVKEQNHNKVHSKGHNLGLKLKQAYDSALKTYDVIITPTMIQLPVKLPTKSATISELVDDVSMANTRTFNLTGHPALSINAGFVQGLPVGMQIIGKCFDELSVLQFARAFEKLEGVA